MSLSQPAARRHMHTRTVQCDGYLREDGLWDIEGSIVDRKPFQYTEPVRGVREPGSDVHRMVIRLTIGWDMVVRAIEVAMPATPYETCINAIPNYQGLVGCKIDGNWRASVKQAVGSTRGCTHARELLFPMATTAFQTLYGWREEGSNTPPVEPKSKEIKPAFIGGCLGWATDGPVVARFYPQFASPAKPDA